MRQHLPPPSEDVSKPFADYVGAASSEQGYEPDYELGVHAVLTGRTITLVLTFLDGFEYCCSDAECHLPLDRGGEWESLREWLDREGVSPPRPLTVRCQTAVRPGATFNESCGRSGPQTEPRRFEFREDRI